MLTAVIPSTNRAGVLHETVISLARQTRRPDEILISVVDAERDVLEATRELPGVRVVTGPKGSTHQRNTAIDHLHPACTLVSFLDDDVELHREYLAHCYEFMSKHSEIAGMSGRAVADGTLIGEVTREKAIRLLADVEAAATTYQPCYAMEGFDMTVRREIADRVRFDERLSLYALYEDFDFSVRAKRYGQLVMVDGCLLVHLRTGSSRMSAVRLGYAQLVNPVYLWWKGSQALYPSLRICARSLSGNVLGCLVARRGITRSERRQRLWGNALGLRDLMVSGPQPESIRRIG